jgi:uncharacterized membrane protein
MESKARMMGHPIHSILIPFPLGLLTTSVIFDIVHLVTGSGKWSVVSFWMIAAGVIGGLVAAVFGLIDWAGDTLRYSRQGGGIVARRNQRAHVGAVRRKLAIACGSAWRSGDGRRNPLPCGSGAGLVGRLSRERAGRPHGCGGLRRGEPRPPKVALRARLDQHTESGIKDALVG